VRRSVRTMGRYRRTLSAPDVAAENSDATKRGACCGEVLWVAHSLCHLSVSLPTIAFCRTPCSNDGPPSRV
jgi:hypothetical protein